MWEFRFQSDFRLFFSSQNPIFRIWMHWIAHLFRHFRLFETFSHRRSHTPVLCSRARGNFPETIPLFFNYSWNEASVWFRYFFAFVVLTTQVDSETGFRTHEMLCMPIKNANGAIQGVSLLVNKIDGTAFNKNDEDMFEVRWRGSSSKIMICWMYNSCSCDNCSND